MIHKIRLRFGSSAAVQPLSFNPGAITVFVGPNNSGKTLILLEIESALFDGPHAHVIPGHRTLEARRILAGIDAEAATWEELRCRLERLYGVGPQVVMRVRPGPEQTLNVPQLIHQIESEGYKHLIDYARVMDALGQVILLDGATRLSLTDQRECGDLRRAPLNPFQAIFIDDKRRRQLREATKDAFGLYSFIDPTAPGRLRMCFSKEVPVKPDIERSLTDEAITFFDSTIPIDNLSDGIKAYAGISAAVLSGNFRVIFIDEPEAFLHPSLARKLGRFLTSTAAERMGNVFASTHSSDFLMGCIQAGKALNVIRLTYEGNATARILDADRLNLLLRDPLLRSTGVLSALFYHGAVVCESDTDRAFYQEVNHRMLRLGRGHDDCIFLNGQNWQTESNIIRPLREMGIPAAGIVDLDAILTEDLKKIMAAAFVPPILIGTWGELRARVKAAFVKKFGDPSDEDKFKRVVKTNGVAALDSPDAEAANNLISGLEDYGIFLVPVGEVERWLLELGVTGHGSRWLVPMFERMGSDPDSATFVKPQMNNGPKDNVWSFVQRITEWMRNPTRKGIPP